MGALCFLLLSFGFEDFYRVPWEHWRRMRELYGRKHLKREELEPFRVRERGNVLYFLEGVGEPDGERQGQEAAGATLVPDIALPIAGA